MTKGKLILAFLFLIILSSFCVNAGYYYEEEFNKFYTRDYDKWVYTEDIKGGNRGFTLVHTWSSPTYRYSINQNIYDVPWDYGYRDSFDSYRYSNQPRYYGGDYYGGYGGNSDVSLDYAFDIYGRKYDSRSRYTGYRRNYW